MRLDVGFTGAVTGGGFDAYQNRIRVFVSVLQGGCEF